MYLSPLAKPTFQRRHSINHCLRRNLIQSLGSLHCDWVYFCFLKSQEFYRWLPDLPSLGKGVGGLLTGKNLLSSNSDLSLRDLPQLGHSRFTAPGNPGECWKHSGHRQPCELVRDPHVITREPCGWGGSGLITPKWRKGPGLRAKSGSGTNSDPPELCDIRQCSWASEGFLPMSVICILHYIIISHYHINTDIW